MKMAITLGWNGEVLAERSSESRARLIWWIRKLAPLYAPDSALPWRTWRYVQQGDRVIVDFGSHEVFAWICFGI